MSLTKVWNGTSWITPTARRVWNGSAWVPIFDIASWNGTSWVKTVLDTPIESHVLTVGSDSGSIPFLSINWSYSGYSNAAVSPFGTVAFGSISPTTSGIYGGATVTQLYTDNNADTLTLNIPGATNSGWTTLYLGLTPFSRVSATFSSGKWTWSGASFTWDYPTTTVKFF